MLRTIKIWKIALTLLFATLLSACESGTTDEGGEVVSSQYGSLTMALLDDKGNATNSIISGDPLTIVVTFRDSNGVGQSGQQVNFNTTLGNLASSSRLTDENGQASVALDSDTIEAGVSTISASTSVSDEELSISMPLDILSKEASVVGENNSVHIGYFDENNNFVEGGIDAGILDANQETTISAGASLGLNVLLVDQDHNRITTPIVIEFSSTCVNNDKANIDAQVATVNGEAQATYQDLSCAGPEGNEDTLVASATVNSVELTASHKVNLLPEKLGSIEFVSASPESIVLKGTGGEGKQETATLTFLVKGELGNPLNQQDVSFSLNTNVGGLTLASETGVTNSEGLVSVKVISGTVPTAVRVTAQVTNDETVIATQSDKLSVNTGLPDQDSLTLALSETNPEALRFITTVNVTAYLADSFNNPVPDGTTVNFTTEGGTIQPTCNTVGGTCTVVWTSTEPYLANHRSTILATAEGHEYFVDVNGNNTYDDADGGAANDTLIINNPDEIYPGSPNKEELVVSGLDRIGALSSGFVDMPEAWRDDNEDGQYQSGELFIDTNNDGVYSEKDGLFNGPQCNASDCTGAKFKTIRKAVVLITSSSKALMRLTQVDTGDIIRSSYGEAATNGDITIARGDTLDFRLDVSDTALQTMPRGTGISVTTTAGTLIGDTSYEVANTIGTRDPNGYGGVSLEFSIHNDLISSSAAITGGLSVEVTTPNEVKTPISVKVELQ